MVYLCLESGRNALMEADGIHLLYSTCLETIDCRELEAVIYASSIIMRKCFPKSRLPITTLRNPLTFAIPHSDVYGSLSTELTEGFSQQTSFLPASTFVNDTTSV